MFIDIGSGVGQVVAGIRSLNTALEHCVGIECNLDRHKLAQKAQTKLLLLELNFPLFASPRMKFYYGNVCEQQFIFIVCNCTHYFSYDLLIPPDTRAILSNVFIACDKAQLFIRFHYDGNDKSGKDHQFMGLNEFDHPIILYKSSTIGTQHHQATVFYRDLSNINIKWRIRSLTNRLDIYVTNYLPKNSLLYQAKFSEASQCRIFSLEEWNNLEENERKLFKWSTLRIWQSPTKSRAKSNKQFAIDRTFYGQSQTELQTTFVLNRQTIQCQYFIYILSSIRYVEVDANNLTTNAQFIIIPRNDSALIDEWEWAIELKRNLSAGETVIM